MATGDLPGAVARVVRELRALKWTAPIDEVGLRLGEPLAILPLLHFVLLKFSRHVAQAIVTAGYELQGKTDLRFVEAAFRLFRECFSIKTVLQPSQFLAQGFSERKVLLLLDVVQVCKKIHNDEVRKERLAALKHRPGSASATRLAELAKKSPPQRSPPQKSPPDVKVIKGVGGREMKQVMAPRHLPNASDGAQSVYDLKLSYLQPTPGGQAASAAQQQPQRQTGSAAASPAAMEAESSWAGAPATSTGSRGAATTPQTPVLPWGLATPSPPSTGQASVGAEASWVSRLQQQGLEATLKPSLASTSTPIHAWFLNPAFTPEERAQQGEALAGAGGAWKPGSFAFPSPGSARDQEQQPDQGPAGQQREEELELAWAGTPGQPKGAATPKLFKQQPQQQQQQQQWWQQTQQQSSWQGEEDGEEEDEVHAGASPASLGPIQEEPFEGAEEQGSPVKASALQQQQRAPRRSYYSSSDEEADEEEAGAVTVVDVAPALTSRAVQPLVQRGPAAHGVGAGAQPGPLHSNLGRLQPAPAPAPAPTRQLLPPAPAPAPQPPRVDLTGPVTASQLDSRLGDTEARVAQQVQELRAQLQRAEEEVQRARDASARLAESLNASVTVLEGRVRFLECELAACMRRGEQPAAAPAPAPVAQQAPEQQLWYQQQQYEQWQLRHQQQEAAGAHTLPGARPPWAGTSMNGSVSGAAAAAPSPSKPSVVALSVVAAAAAGRPLGGVAGSSRAPPDTPTRGAASAAPLAAAYTSAAGSVLLSAPTPSFAFQPTSLMQAQFAVAQEAMAQAGLMPRTSHAGSVASTSAQAQQHAAPAAHVFESAEWTAAGAPAAAAPMPARRMSDAMAGLPAVPSVSTAAPPLAAAASVAASVDGTASASTSARALPAESGNTRELISSLVSRYTDAQAFLQSLRAR